MELLRDGVSAAGTRRLDRSLAAAERLSELIPGGAHTYAKGEDQFPEGLAPVLVSGHGCRVVDVDGNEYIEYGMGLRAVVLGHGRSEVAAAVARQAALGTNFTRPATIELEVAEALLGCVGADMVKFTKDGSTANTAALRLARAVTGRDVVALCADHPFFSYDDWFIATTPMRAGIPPSVDPLTATFRYNDLRSLEEVFAEHPGAVACVMLEPERVEPPRDGFLEEVRRLCDVHGAVLVFDENVSGFRWDLGGAQAVHGVVPDLSTFGKAMANGFALSALVGKRELMELGGLRTDRDRVFLLSTTHGAEHTALAAAIATIGIFRSEPVIERLHAQGRRLQDGVNERAAARGIADAFSVFGHPACLFYGTRDAEGRPSQPFRTLFLQETIERGLLAPSFVISEAHDDDAVEQTVEIVDAALGVYARALDEGVERYLRGRPVKPVFRARS
jgi:glutamate-1-semialdehyde 2,1-aminomutase